MKAVNDDVSAAAGYAALLIGWANDLISRL
jgi:hypothetical protein